MTHSNPKRSRLLNLVQTQFPAHSARRKEAKRFAKFATVGAAGFITHFTLLNLLIQLARFPHAFANPFGFAAAVLQNFALNRRWTYPESRSHNALGQLARFVLVSIVGLGINQMIFLTVHNWLEPTWVSLMGEQKLGDLISYNFALLVAVGMVMIWNFGVNRLWTYRGI